MTRPRVRVIVLFEDEAHASFLRRLVEHLNLKPVRYQRCVDCNGVLSALQNEVLALRSQNFQKNLGLIVMIDADGQGLSGRSAELHQVVRLAGGERVADDRIAFLVPALEVENWYVHLCCPESRPVGELRDYKRSPEWKELKKDLGAASRKALNAWQPQPGREDPTSLVTARKELERVS